MDNRFARDHWIALDALFAGSLTPADRARAEQAFAGYVDAVADVCSQLLPNLPLALHDTAAALKDALASEWSAIEDGPRFP